MSLVYTILISVRLAEHPPPFIEADTEEDRMTRGVILILDRRTTR